MLSKLTISMYKVNFSIVFVFTAITINFTHSFPEKFDHLHHIKTASTNEIQTQAAYEVIKRILPEKADQFKITVDSNYTDHNFDKFTILKNGDVVEIIGSSGVTVTWGFHYYLKYYCSSHIGWQVKQITIPDELPDVNVTIVSKDRIRYYQNVCTTSYSFVWWNLEDWRRHIDWIALNGFNLVLAPHAQESIWQIVFKKMNLTDQEINEHFSGPAFLSWYKSIFDRIVQRMGNLRGWGGPLSDQWHKHTLDLQTFIVKAMTDLGINPALPAFAGFVPTAFKRLFPTAKLSVVEPWNNFPSQYCCPLFLDPTDPLFSHTGKLFLTEMTNKFGLTHVYYSDSFNEVRPTSDDNEFLKNVGRAIYETMTSVDRDSIWLLQNWMFVNEHAYWTPERAKAFLTSVPIGRMIILDLQSEQWPQFERFNMYFGQPFIWNMLHNFGGTLGMFGSASKINENVYKTRNAVNSTMVGVGITPEGINQNYIMYDLVLEIPWNEGPVNLGDWVTKYAQRRYGFLDQQIYNAWATLINTIYNYGGLNRIRGKYAISRRPSLSIETWAWYSKKDLIKSWKYFLNGNETYHTIDSYRHDLVDITRQFLQYQGDQLYPALIEAYVKNDAENFSKYAQLFLDVFDDMEEILSTHRSFLLGNWLNSAKNISQSVKDKKLFEYNARNQITLWGPNGQIADYANKQWAGIISDYFKPRWEIFLKAMSEYLVEGIKFDKKKVKLDMFTKAEEPFTLDNKEYPTTENGDSYEISKNIFEKWSKLNLSLPDVPIKIISKISQDFNEIDDFIKNDNEMYLEKIPSVVIIN